MLPRRLVAVSAVLGLGAAFAAQSIHADRNTYHRCIPAKVVNFNPVYHVSPLQKSVSVSFNLVIQKGGDDTYYSVFEDGESLYWAIDLHGDPVNDPAVAYNYKWHGGIHKFVLYVSTCTAHIEIAKTVNWPKKPSLRAYIALGDSYSSGEANPPFDLSPTCHRSSSAWPSVMAKNIHRTLVNVACSGAKMDDLTNEFKSQSPQLDAIRHTPSDLITVTVGGNDLGFGPVLHDCFVRNCVKDGVLAQKEREIAALQAKLTLEYKLIRSYANEGQPVVVVEYPDIFPFSNTYKCGWLSFEEQKEIYILSRSLYEAIDNAADEANVDVVDLRDVFDNHELCTKNSWFYPIGRLPLSYDGHPTQQGQLAMAKYIAYRLY